MNETHPLIGVVASIGFLVLGVVSVTMPETFQRLAQRSQDRAPWTRRIPFASFAWSADYVPALRVLGTVAIVVGLFVLIVSLLELRRQV